MSKISSYPLYKSLLVVGATSELFDRLIKDLLPYVEKFTCIGRNSEQLKTLQKLYPTHVDIIRLDLDEEPSYQTIETLLKTQSFDGLLQFQGFGIYGLFKDIPWQDHEKIMQLNLLSLMRIFHLFTKHQLSPANKKIVIHATSLAGLVYCPYLASYSAAKASLHHFTQTMAMEFSKELTIMSICPKAFGKNFSIKASKGFYENPQTIENYTKKVVSAFFHALIKKKPITFCTLSDRIQAFCYYLFPKKFLFYLFKKKMSDHIK